VKPLYLTLALAAGLAGGLISHYVWPQPVQAQAPASMEIRAQRFVLEDSTGRTLGTLSVELPRSGKLVRSAAGTIHLFDERGHEI
jgi:hypothetical protein